MPSRFPRAPRLHRRSGAALALAATMALAFVRLPAHAEGAARLLPPPAVDVPATAAPQTAVLSGGCFWGVQGVFEHVRGVRKVLAGYAGGGAATATTRRSARRHRARGNGADDLRPAADHLRPHPADLLLGGARPDRSEPAGAGRGHAVSLGDLRRPIAAQARVAAAYIAQLDRSRAFARPIATRVDPLGGFYPAEAYHQDYLDRHPDQPYIAINDIPKVET